MFPQFSDIINYIFGTNIHLPIQTYGFFVALAFVSGAYIIKTELKRKEKLGKLQTITKKILKGAPAKPLELILSGIFGLLLGFKLGGMILDYENFADNPQSYLLSSEGNIWFGLLLAAGMVFWRYYSKKKSRLDKPVWEDIVIHPYQLAGNILIIAALSGLLGAKLFHNLENFDDLIKDPVNSIFSFMGLTFYGGLIVGSITVVLYARKNKIPVLHLIDAAAPAIIMSYGIGRLGCMMSGDGCWGIVNTHPKPDWMSWLPDWMWAYKFPHNVVGEGIPIDNCTGKFCTILEQPVYPTSFYDFLLCTIFFAVLMFAARKINIPGALFSIMLILIGIQRFFMEQIRVNNVLNTLGIEYTQAELISIILILLGITGLWFFYKKNQKKSKNLVV